MDSPSKKSRYLQHLTTNFQNRSCTSIVTSVSDAATFHSAEGHHSHVEMQPMCQPSTSKSITRPTSPSPPNPQHSPKLDSFKMNRQDSGYGETTDSPLSSRRTSSSSARRNSPSKSKRRCTTTSSRRPSTRRATRSSPSSIPTARTSISSTQRPNLPTRHTHATSIQNTHQYFHFPTLSDPQESSCTTKATPKPAPPPTVQYWTSDSTRRLEYAAIDAASRGVRGFFIRLVPDCILPAASRRVKFHEGEDADSDVGSVRRYRLELPEEKEIGECVTANGEGRVRGGLWRRLSGGIGRGRGSGGS